MATHQMAYEMLVGLNVLDDDLYSQYRAAMKPILQRFEGGFGYDFEVSKVLRSESNEIINRVFTIHFSSKVNMESFFSDSTYIQVKEQFFNASVGATTIISSYEK